MHGNWIGIESVEHGRMPKGAHWTAELGDTCELEDFLIRQARPLSISSRDARINEKFKELLLNAKVEQT